MKTVFIEPDAEHPVPYQFEDKELTSTREAMAAAGNTAELLVSLGSPLTENQEEIEEASNQLKEVVKKKKFSNLNNINTAFAASAFLKTYGQNLALDVASARAAITNKLMELANCGMPQYELKALELLGKIQDIALFTNRSEVTINYNDPQDLENAIKERVKRLLNAQIIDVSPIKDTLDEDLGTFGEESQ